MLIMTPEGLYCPTGDFYIDPKRAVENAVITHAHSDHARRGSNTYYTTTCGVDLLKTRLGKKIKVIAHPYREKFTIKDVEVSFHPAGHILGSSQVRLGLYGEVWVVSGDYKRDPDPTCEPFESVPCDVFITEATFGTPAYRWDKNANFGQAIHQWWLANANAGYNSVILAYSLGKAQRILGEVARLAHKPIYCHPAAEKLNHCYRAQNILLAKTICLSQVKRDAVLQNELFIVPSAFLRSEEVSILGANYKIAFASGWMAKKTSHYDNGFTLSDHADWHDLLSSVKQTGARRVYVQHRGTGALVRELRTLGIQAFSDRKLFPKNPNQLLLF